MKVFFLIMCLGVMVCVNAQQTKKVVKQVEKSVIKDDNNSSETKSMEISKKIVDGKEVSQYKLTHIVNGETRIVEWEGVGEMPLEIKEELEKTNDLDSKRNKVGVHKEKKVIIEIDDDGNEKVLEWDGEGEMPEEMEGLLKEHGIEMDEDIILEDGKMRKRTMKRDEPMYDVKVRMGVGLNPTENGVALEYVEDKSPAADGGLLKDDVLLKIGDVYILSQDLVFKALSRFNPNDKVNVVVLRDGQELTFKLKLAAKE